MAIFFSVDYLPGSEGSASAEIGAETLVRMQHFANGIVSFTALQPEGGALVFHKATTRNENNDADALDHKCNRRLDF